MRPETTDLLLAALLPAHRNEPGSAQDWMRAFALGRIGVLGVTICALPLVLAAAPQTMAGLFGLFVALVIANACGLLGLRAGLPGLAVLASSAGLSAVALGPLPSGAAPALLAIGIIAVLCDLAALPSAMAGRAMRTACAALAIVPGLSALALDRFGGWDEVLAMAVPVLALAPLLTLCLALHFSRGRLLVEAERASLSADRGEHLLKAAGVAVLIVDRGGHVLDRTEEVARMLRCEAGDLSGRGLIDRVLIADRPALLKAVSEASSASLQTELMLRLCVWPGHSEGREPPAFAPFTLRVGPFPGHAGSVAIRMEQAAAQPVGQDRSEGHEARLALLQQIGHEIRTPMNAILGFSEVLVDASVAPKRPDQVVDYARIIHRSAREAFAISSALVDLLRSEANGVALASETLELAEIADAAARLVNERAPVPVRVERAAGDVLVETDGHACRTLLKAILESFSTAFDGRSQVLCQIGRTGLTPQVLVTARDMAEATSTRGSVPAGHFGVMEALCARLGHEIGCSIVLDVTGSTLSARIEFPRAGLGRARHAAAPTPVPLRKSA